MGYIERAAGIPSFNKAVISLWFRVTEESIAAAVADYYARARYPGIDENPGLRDDLRCVGIIPLITFGQKGAFRESTESMDPELAYDFTSETGPSMIGIRCGPLRGDDDYDGPDTAMLYTRIEMNANGQWGTGETDIEVLPDFSGTNTYYTDYFEVGGMSSYYYSPFVTEVPTARDFIEVTPDEWHHVLISFDVSNGSDFIWDVSGEITVLSFGTLSQFNWSFDDVHKSGADGFLFPCGSGGYGGAANGIFSARSGQVQYVDEEEVVQNTPLAPALSIPTSGAPIAIPTIGDYVDFNRNVIMAEVQIFTDVTLDTSVEANRRAFITSSGNPASPSLAADLLGKAPEVYFRTHSQWSDGDNQGSAGNFTPTGTVLPFTPSP